MVRTRNNPRPQQKRLKGFREKGPRKGKEEGPASRRDQTASSERTSPGKKRNQPAEKKKGRTKRGELEKNREMAVSSQEEVSYLAKTVFLEKRSKLRPAKKRKKDPRKKSRRKTEKGEFLICGW